VRLTGLPEILRATTCFRQQARAVGRMGGQVWFECGSFATALALLTFGCRWFRMAAAKGGTTTAECELAHFATVLGRL
jgi:hypothetical protein